MSPGVALLALFAALQHHSLAPRAKGLSTKLCSSPHPHQPTASDDNVDGYDPLALLSSTVKEFAEKEAPAWLRDMKSLPFSCTECGKCCSRTEGAVYLSQPEIYRAAAALDMDDVAFVRQYASHTLRKSNGDQWMRLKRTEGVGCVFLDPATNHCQIYQARPIQCSAYPFYPNLLESKEAWNAECRRRDDDEESPLPKWEPHTGGCEGMSIIGDEEDQKEETGSSDGNPSLADEDEGVPIHRVYEILHEMQRLEEDMYRKDDE